MSAANRANLLAKIQKVCKKNFQPVKPSESRNVFETIIFGCCLEDATFEQAEEAFARLQELYFDWNEVRVTTAPELAEAMVGYHDPTVAATRVKKCLHSIFETHYTFDIDFLKKENLGKAVEKVRGYKGITDFVVSYVSQSALGGHSIPLGAAEKELLLAADVITAKEKQKSTVPGLERAIPKSKGIEFFSTVHQLAVPFLMTPNSTKVWAVIGEIDSKAKARFNQRVKEEKAALQAAEEKREAARKKKAAAKRAAAKKAAEEAAAPKKRAAKKAAAAKTPVKKAPAKKAPAKKAAVKKTPAKKAPAKKTPVKKAPAKKTPAKKAPAKKSPAKKAVKSAPARKATKKAKSATKRVAKKKPR